MMEHFLDNFSCKYVNSKTQLAGAGTQPAALGFGGGFNRLTATATEEWTGAGLPLTKTITVS
jgi:hypothetical protein